MGAGANDAWARGRGRQAVNRDAFIAANTAASKATATSQVVIGNQASSLGHHHTVDENTTSEHSKGKSMNTGASVANSPTESAKISLAQTLTQDNERLWVENQRHEDNIRALNSGLANLKKSLDFKREECVRLTRQGEQRDQALIEEQSRFVDEQARFQREFANSNEKCTADCAKLRERIESLKEEKEHVDKALSENNIEKVSTFDALHAEQKKCEELQTALDEIEQERQRLQETIFQMKEEKLQRKAEIDTFVKKARLQKKSLEADVERLTAQGNRLVAQNSRRRTYAPTEDDSKVVNAFHSLHDGIRCWTIDVIEAVQTERADAELEFWKFPLGAKEARTKMSTDEIPLLIGYVWEWLMRSVFGSDQCRENISNQLFDLWTDADVAESLRLLERKVSVLQKAGLVHEWRSFTVQCLAEKIDETGSSRVEEIMKEAASWLVPVSTLEGGKAHEIIEVLLQTLQKNVVVPAIEFSKILRQRYTPILLKTPQLLEDAVEDWYKIQFQKGGPPPEMTIVIRPQLCKENVDLPNGEKGTIEILVEAERFKMIDLNDPVDTDSSNSTGDCDKRMSDG